MVFQISGHFTIENLRDYPEGIVDHLRELLMSGAIARPDPNRTNFYDVENNDRTFFIHVPPSGGKVMLLAAWPHALPLTESAPEPA